MTYSKKLLEEYSQQFSTSLLDVEQQHETLRQAAHTVQHEQEALEHPVNNESADFEKIARNCEELIDKLQRYLETEEQDEAVTEQNRREKEDAITALRRETATIQSEYIESQKKSEQILAECRDELTEFERKTKALQNHATGIAEAHANHLRLFSTESAEPVAETLAERTSVDDQPEISTIFEEALARAKDYNHPAFQNYVNQLKSKTLAALESGHTLYTVGNCRTIATATRDLAQTLNIDAFENTTKPFRKSIWFNAIATSLVGIALGILVVGVFSTLAVALVAGAIVGGTIGFFAAKGLTQLRDPFVQMRSSLPSP